MKKIRAFKSIPAMLLCAAFIFSAASCNSGGNTGKTDSSGKSDTSSTESLSSGEVTSGEGSDAASSDTQSSNTQSKNGSSAKPGAGSTASVTSVKKQNKYSIDASFSGSVKLSYVPGDQGEMEMAAAIRESFIKKYPKIKTVISAMSGDYTSTVLKQAAAGTLADVFWTEEARTTQFASRNIIADLEPYIKETGFDRSLYYESMMNCGKFKWTGNQYMLPRDYTRVMVYYNKKLFKDAGVAYPKDDWTWQDFLNTCAALKTKIPANANVVSLGWGWEPNNNAFVEAYGGHIFDKNGKLSLDSKALSGADAMKNLITQGYTIANPPADGFYSGLTAMAFSTRTHQSMMKFFKLDYDVATFPAIGSSPKVPSGASGYVMFSKTKNEKAAWAMLEHIMSVEGQRALAATGNTIPVMKSLANDSSWRNFEPNINNDAFFKYTERDCNADYLKYISNTDKYEAIRQRMNQFFTAYVTTSTSVNKLLSDLEKDIEMFKSDT